MATDAPPHADSTSAVDKAGLSLGGDVALALEVAATEFHSGGAYTLEGASRTSEQMVEYYAQLVDGFPLVSIEDPLDEDDWEG